MKCIALFSGGLDSILAAKLMKEKGFNVILLYIHTPFYTRKPFEVKKREIEERAAELGMPFIIHKVGEEYLEIVKKPKFGYGKHLNPCIDCKIFFFKIAKIYMEQLKAKCVISGEVLGQRGMSQRRDAIMKIEREAGLKGKIVRPLSLNFFPPTDLEKQGILKPQDFPMIKGRSRKVQIELAKKLGITNTPQPAGGCLLTVKEYSERLKVLLSEKLYNLEAVEIIKYGRFITDDGIYVVSRNAFENKMLQKWCRNSYKIYIPPFNGPTVCVLKGNLSIAQKLACLYTKHCNSL